MTDVDSIFQGLGVEIELPDEKKFSIIVETLERIGIPSFKNDTKTLFQSCHILHKRGRYVIIHFLELFKLDGRTSTITDDDLQRRDAIALMLEDWGLLKILPAEKKKIDPDVRDKVRVKVVKYSERDDWVLKPKYHVGKK